MRKKPTTYSKEFKYKAIKMYEELGMGYKRMTQELGVSDKSVVRRWIRAYKAEGDKGLEGKSRKKKSPSIRKSLSHDESLVEENTRLPPVCLEKETVLITPGWRASLDTSNRK